MILGTVDLGGIVTALISGIVIGFCIGLIFYDMHRVKK